MKPRPPHSTDHAVVALTVSSIERAHIAEKAAEGGLTYRGRSLASVCLIKPSPVSSEMALAES